MLQTLMLVVLGATIASSEPFVPGDREPADWFDFYEGRWSYTSDQMTGTVEVELFNDGRIMRSVFEGNAGEQTYVGVGVAYYDEEQQVWIQRFADSSGEGLDVSYVADGPSLVGTWRGDSNGTAYAAQFIFHDIDADGFVATVQIKPDGEDEFRTTQEMSFERLSD